MKAPVCILTIAGSDSGAGAGIQADSRVIQSLGGYAATAVTAVTAQNTRGVIAWQAVPPRLLAAQIEAVLADLPVAAIKTGLLPGAAAIRAVATVLTRHPRRPLVIDPVAGSSSGTRFLDPAGQRALRRHLLPLATLITPNRPEAALLTGLPVTNDREAERAGRLLQREIGCGAVLVKGGHARGHTCRDCLILADGRVRWLEHPRIRTPNTHGTGCMLSAVIAWHLGRGRTVPHSVARACAVLEGSLRAGRRTRFGAGAGPAGLGMGGGER